VLGRRQRIELRPQRRLACQIEAAVRKPGQRRRQRRLRHRRNRQIEPDILRRKDLLPRHPEPVREQRAQALVPRHHVVERFGERGAVERPA
jgi:hypothetical protein